MNVLIIGLGSMGRRRIRLLKELDKTINIYGLDKNIQRREEVSNELDIHLVDTLDDIITNKIGYVFICTSPLAHENIVMELLKYKVHIFSELNLRFSKYDLLEKELKKRDEIYFLSSTCLYRKDIEFIIDKAKNGAKTSNYIYHSGQYLPDWHPWEDYKDFFVAHKESSGIREILAIEFPWIIEAFGTIETVNVISNKITNLDIDYNDTCILSIKHESGTCGSIVVDVVSREATSRLEVINEEFHLNWKGTPESLEFKNAGEDFESINLYDGINRQENYTQNIVENAYLEEIIEFFNTSKEKSKSRYSVEFEKKVHLLLDYIDKEME